MIKVLIIEDDIALQDTTAEFLIEEGFEICKAVNGIEGIQKAIEEIPDIILCDIAMPKLNGYEVFKFLSENSATNNIPFIFITAKTENEDIRTGMQLGADDYITKPFDFDELLKAINVRLKKRNKLIASYENQFKNILNFSLAGVFIFQEAKFIFSNNKFHKLCGYSPEEISTLTFEKIIHHDDLENILEKSRRCTRGIQNSYSAKVKLIQKDKNTISALISCNLIQINNKPAIIGNIIEQSINLEIPENNIDQINDIITFLSNNRNKISDEMLNKIFSTTTDNDSNRNPDHLSKREFEILQYICQGYTNHEIADKLFISPRTVDSHRSNLLSKTNSKNTAELITYAIKNRFYIVI